MFQILLCEDPGVLRVIYLVKIALNIIRYVLPIVLILKVSLDIYKNILAGDTDKESIVKKVGNRIVACIIVFCIPTIIKLLFSLLGNVDIGNIQGKDSFLVCFNEASRDLIEELEEIKAEKLSEEEEQKRIEDSVNVQKFYAELEATSEYNKQHMSTEGSTWNSHLTDLNKQNGVYVKDGVFYKPKGASGKNCPEGDATKKGYRNKYGYNDYFFDMLTNLQNAAKAAGYKFTYSNDGCRSYDAQVATYKKYANEPGRAAKPGNSNHGWGVAADLDFASSAARKWVHAHAKEYGLHFPLYGSNYKGYQEPWHIEPINLKTY